MRVTARPHAPAALPHAKVLPVQIGQWVDSIAHLVYRRENSYFVPAQVRTTNLASRSIVARPTELPELHFTVL